MNPLYMNHVQPEHSLIGVSGQANYPGTGALVPLELENRFVRQAVQEHLVSFPSQVPVFEKQSRPDLQAKLVVLYFVRGWTMDDIAKRYGLGRQRMGQILTAWRIRAVKEGYIQAIEPEHPLFKRVRAEQPSEFAEPSLSAALPEHPAPTAPIDNEESPAAISGVSELGGPILAEELHAIVSILDNQLRLCSNPLNGTIDSCELLLARAKALCDRLETRSSTHSNEGWRKTAVISAARKLFQRFQEHAVERSKRLSMPMFGNHRNISPRTSQRVALSVVLEKDQLRHGPEIASQVRGSSPAPPTH